MWKFVAGKSKLKYGELSNSQKQAVITLVEKRGKDKRQIKNWRPVSLINADAKMASKTSWPSGWKMSYPK